MRFAAAKITNYRQYKSLEFNFSKSCENDLHAIIASNGVGKTNLLNAINWCLYGKEPHMDVVEGETDYDDSEEDKLSLGNVEVLEEAKNAGEETCTVQVTIVAEAEDDNSNIESAEITRSVEVNTSTYFIASEDKFEIKVTTSTGEPEFLYGAEAKDYINRYMPETIREYFFFDGEQLLKYFDVNKKKHIEATINNIAQIDSLKGVRKHLEQIIQDYRKELKKNDPQLEAKEKALAKAEEDVKAKEADIEAIIQAISISEQIIAEKDSIISGTESLVKDNDKYNKNAERITELVEKKEKLLGKLRMLIREYAVLLMLYEANMKTYSYIESNVGSDTASMDVDIKAIKKTLETGQCVICEDPINDREELIERLKKLVDRYDQTGASHIKLTEIKNDIFRAITKAKDYKTEKKAILDELTNVEDEIDTLQDENADLQSRIKMYSEKSIDEVKQATTEKFENEDLISRNREKLGSYRENLKTLKQIKKEAEEAFDKARSANSENEEINKKLTFVLKAASICDEIIEEIVTDVQGRMSKETKELFDQLIWKKETYGDIELSSDYRLKIFHKRTGQSCLKSLSDSEKELLALAFTISLHNVSGYQNLLFIDTPVGRVSDENRTNFSKVLLDISKQKQIILAFTPSEFKDEVEAVFTDDVLSSKYKLSTNEFITKAVKVNG